MSRRRRCPAIEGPVEWPQSSSQCVRDKGHPPPHECGHGFHFLDAPGNFKGVCSHCGQNVELKEIKV